VHNTDSLSATHQYLGGQRKYKVSRTATVSNMNYTITAYSQ